MDKYTLFRKLMDLVSDEAEVTYAFMDTTSTLGISIEGECDGKRIKISAMEEVIENA